MYQFYGCQASNSKEALLSQMNKEEIVSFARAVKVISKETLNAGIIHVLFDNITRAYESREMSRPAFFSMLVEWALLKFPDIDPVDALHQIVHFHCAQFGAVEESINFQVKMKEDKAQAIFKKYATLLYKVFVEFAKRDKRDMGDMDTINGLEFMELCENYNFVSGGISRRKCMVAYCMSQDIDANGG
jgi:hypothetical protein